jgi:hypothetical protein
MKGDYVKKFVIVGKNFLLILLSGLWIAYGLFAVVQKNAADFTAFYGAAKNILVGINPYGLYKTIGGGISGFQSPLWLSYFFVPLTLFPINVALIVYKLVNLVIVIGCFFLILRWQTSKVPLLVVLYLLGCILVLSANTMLLGQVTIIQLASAILMIVALKHNRPFVAGLALPLILIKPHLVLFFLFAAFRRGGRKMLFAGVLSTCFFVIISILTRHTWITDLLGEIIRGQQYSTMEWNKFVTVSGLFSLPPWLNIVIWLLSLPVLIMLDNKFHSVPSNIWLPITLVLSLATTPYAFAYDLPLLIPALIGLCFPWSRFSIIAISVVTFVTIFAGFSSIAYIEVIFIAIFSIHRVIIQKSLQVDESISPLTPL